MPELLSSPPWYTFANEIKYTYGRSPFVKVNDLISINGGNYVLIINVCSDSVAYALRQVLYSSVEFGNIIVSIIILDSKGKEVTIANTDYTPETLAKLFCTALKMNPLFIGTVLKPEVVPPTIGDVTVVIKKDVVQFFNDDISDLCSNYNEVAAKTFTIVTNPEYVANLVARFSTYDPNCKLQQNIYCPNCPKKTKC